MNAARHEPPTEAPRSRGARALDFAIVPFFLIGMAAAAEVWLMRGVPTLLVTPLVVGPFAGLAALLERIRPERADCVELDLPISHEAVHFVFNFELGYGISLGASWLVERLVHAALPLPLWPTQWPLVAQVVLAIALYETLSYFQHRALHRVPALFRFHALHHSGARLNLVRVVRFHAVDIATAAFTAYLPLVVLGAPEPIVTRMVAVLGALGILQHANIRMRTPAFLDRIVCTPAVHRHHHSASRDENDRNFANTFMIFDQIFGTYAVPRSQGPVRLGLEDDPVPRGLWEQIVGPFRSPATDRRPPAPSLAPATAPGLGCPPDSEGADA